MNGKELMVVACIFGAAAVLIGAFGAHMLSDLMTPLEKVNFKTGSQYHFIHTLAALFTGYYMNRSGKRWALQLSGYLFLGGIAMFSFPLYAYGAGGNWVKYLPPFGGTSLVLAWVFLAIGVVTKAKKAVGSE